MAIKLSEIITLPPPDKVVKWTKKDEQALVEELIEANKRYKESKAEISLSGVEVSGS